jgi:hypothetical protein
MSTIAKMRRVGNGGYWPIVLKKSELGAGEGWRWITL